jgi:hypothetical protein
MCIMKNFLFLHYEQFSSCLEVFQLFNSSYILVLSERILHVISIPLVFKVCFVAQSVVCVGECAHDLENNVYSLVVGCGILQYQMAPVDG